MSKAETLLMLRRIARCLLDSRCMMESPDGIMRLQLGADIVQIDMELRQLHAMGQATDEQLAEIQTK